MNALSSVIEVVATRDFVYRESEQLIGYESQQSSIQRRGIREAAVSATVC